MEELHKQVRRARRRLALQRFVAALGWCLTVSGTAAVLGILAGRFWPTGVADGVWAAAAVGVGLLAAVFWALLKAGRAIDAAIEIDHRFGLKERVSSSLALSLEERDTPAGRALVDDAVRRVKRIDVGQRMKVSPRRALLFPLVPALVGLLVALWASPAVIDNPAEASADPVAVQKQVQRSAERLERRLEEKRKEAENQGLKEAEQVFKLLQQGAKDLSTQAPEDQKKALVQLNDLAKQLQERRDKAGGAEQIRQKLNQMKNFLPGPADKLAQAVKQGDFKKAVEELKNLQKELADGKLDDKQRQQLADQMRQMQEKLQAMSDAQKQAEEELKKRQEQAKQAGDQKKADELQQQLDKLQQQSRQNQQMDRIAQQLKQCADCVKNGQMQQAADAMKQLEGQLADLKKQLEEMELLDEAMEQLAQCREGMGCKKCGGEGCEACRGGVGGMGNKPGKGADGLGGGEGGSGERPEQKNDTAFRDSNVRQKVGEGSMTVTGEVDGPNKKGQVEEEIKQQLDAAKHQASDPLTGQRMPQSHRQHAKEYFERLRKGE